MEKLILCIAQDYEQARRWCRETAKTLELQGEELTVRYQRIEHGDTRYLFVPGSSRYDVDRMLGLTPDEINVRGTMHSDVEQFIRTRMAPVTRLGPI